MIAFIHSFIIYSFIHLLMMWYSCILAFIHVHVLLLFVRECIINARYTLPDLGLDAVEWLGRTLLPSSWLDNDAGCVNWPEGPDVFVHLHMMLFVILALISPQRLKIIRRLFVIFAILNALRAITVIVTSLPDASRKCAAQWEDPALGGYVCIQCQ